VGRFKPAVGQTHADSQDEHRRPPRATPEDDRQRRHHEECPPGSQHDAAGEEAGRAGNGELGDGRHAARSGQPVAGFR